MIRAVAALLFAVGLTFLLASPSLAFDGKRKGFILGVGLGPSFTSTAEKFEFTGFPEQTTNHRNLGAATDFRIGLGATDQLLIYYNNKVSWFGLEENIFASGLTSVAVSYYTRPSAPSGYFTGGIGAAGWSQPFENSGGSIGLGVFGGCGYEFSKLFTVEGTVSYGAPSEDRENLKVTENALDVRVTINLLGY